MSDGRPLSAPCLRPSMWVAVLALAATAPIRAQEAPVPPPAVVEGIPAGLFYLKPFLGLGVSGETNPLYDPEGANPTEDIVSRANAAFQAMLPFHRSYARIDYNGTFRRFAKNDVPNPDSRNVLAELSLRFSSSDRIVANIDRTTGAAELLSFDGGEKTYDGTPFRYAIYTAGAERDEAGHLGYQVGAIWSALNFDNSDVNFFEFRGYDAAADIHVPVSPTLWIVAGLGARRFDHKDTSTGLLFRKEQADDVRCGVRGLLSRGGTYRAVFAYDHAEFPGGSGSDFSGIVGDVSVVLTVGPSASVTFLAARRRWSSFYGDNNYYMANTIGASAGYRWPGSTEVGATVGLGRSAYPDPVNIAAGGPARRDTEWNTEAYATFAFARLYGVRVSYTGRFRNSSDDGVSYDAQSVGVQLVVGWR